MTEIGYFREIKECELEMMLAWRNQPSVREDMYTQHEISWDEHIAWWGRLKQQATQIYLMYECDGQPQGVVYFTSIDKSNSNCAWGFYSSQDAPRGTGTKMEFLALEYAFTDLGLYKLWCEVLAYNAAVIRLHGKFGFLQEGVFRQQFKRGDEYFDIVRMGMLSSEWTSQRDGMKQRIIALNR